MIRGGGWWSADQIAAMIFSAKAEAWNEGVLAMSKALQGGDEPLNPYDIKENDDSDSE